MVLAIGCVAKPVVKDIPAAPPVTPAVIAPTTPPITDYTLAAQPPVAPIVTGEPPTNRTWLSPGKVDIGNYYPGATAEWNITIHNGKPVPAKFSVTYRSPDYTATGYSKVDAQDWVIVADTTPILAAYETRDILVTLKIPEKTKNVPAKWEYWISVMDKSQVGNVATELCSRWLVNMR